MKTLGFAFVLAAVGFSGALAACGGDDFSSCDANNDCGGAGGKDGGADAAGGASGASGTGGGAGGSSGTGGSGGAGGDGGSCDTTKSPAEAACLVDEQYGVFVDAGSTAGSPDGSRSAPYKTIGAALANAGSKKIFVCNTHGSYKETVSVTKSSTTSGLYGGFSCSDWKYSTASRAVVESSDPIAWKVEGVNGLAIENFEVKAAHAKAAGEASIAMLVANAKNVSVVSSKLVAGNGKDGSKGSEITTNAEKGADGKKGTDACVGQPAGGAASTTFCGGTPTGSIGGKGGDGATSIAGNGGNGDNGSPLGSGGKGGAGETSSPFTCVTGNGTPGNPGNPGKGSNSPGTLTASGFAAAVAGAGTDGGVGQGGGGGGGAKAPTASTACGGANASKTGASGGSGGGGGCGGKGGGGGQGGGASIALASVDSPGLTLTNCDLVASNGGKGGDGGAGQPGGSGGGSGPAGSGASGSADGCPGGIGGKGGNGGPGGGGAGGASVGVAYVGPKPVRTGGSVTKATTPAAGGADGTGATTGDGVGAAGKVEDELAF